MARQVGKKQMRPGPATRAASHVDFRACFSRYAGEMLKVRQRSAAGVPLLPELVADHDFHHRSASTAGIRGLILFKDRMRRRPQCPHHQHALTRGLEMPPAIHSRESPACPWPCRIINKLHKLSRSHCRHFAAGRSCPQQENLLPLCRSCELCGLLVESHGKNRVKSGSVVLKRSPRVTFATALPGAQLRF